MAVRLTLSPLTMAASCASLQKFRTIRRLRGPASLAASRGPPQVAWAPVFRDR